MSRAAELLHRMVGELIARGDLPPDWREAFLAVPRHAFLPDTVWRRDADAEDDYDLRPLHRGEDPDAWLALAYANAVVITQVDDGHPSGPDLAGYASSSSASMPTMVAIMLGALEVEPGMTVCETGTGTGYNAALLAHRLGSENVTTIEVDPVLAESARKALADAGYGGVKVVSADGALGHPPRAPFDRVLSTASCHQVPYPWATQTRPGGRIVTPWGNAYVEGLLTLTVAGDSGCGGIVAPSSFMRLRDQRQASVASSDIVHEDDQPTETTTRTHPYRVAGNFDAMLAISLRVPDCEHRHQPYDKSGQGVLWFLDPGSRSWASLTYTDPQADQEEFRIRQFGVRKLWDEVESAYRWWINAGSPVADRWRFTVSAEGQRIELA